MEQKWRWDRTYITKWINYMMRWMMDRWAHLLELNVELMSAYAPYYAAAVGRKLRYNDPTAQRIILFIDGVFV